MAQLMEQAVTNKDVILQILSEASGRPLKEIEHIASDGLPFLGSTGSMGKELSDQEAADLLTRLRGMLPAVNRWLHEGGRLEAIDRATGKSSTH
jgi:hypothetical protein